VDVKEMVPDKSDPVCEAVALPVKEAEALVGPLDPVEETEPLIETGLLE
jgi:hypothetical protein